MAEVKNWKKDFGQRVSKQDQRLKGKSQKSSPGFEAVVVGELDPWKCRGTALARELE